MYDELIVPPRVLLGPGPSEANARVLKAMTTPMLGYLDTKICRSDGRHGGAAPPSLWN